MTVRTTDHRVTDPVLSASLAEADAEVQAAITAELERQEPTSTAHHRGAHPALSRADQDPARTRHLAHR